jgi:poly-gamma-glutamate capsule biosynthesis protein CapA/YwtB (metallophosphatase superfamily)
VLKGAVICAICGAAFLFTSKSAVPQPLESNKTTIALTETPDTLTFLFAGDIMGHMDQIESARTGKHTFDYNHCFEQISPIISAFDVSVGNLELTLPGEEPYYGFPMFKSPNALAGALKNAGFDLLVTANNHCGDSKLKGVLGTINCLDSLNLMHTGTFRSAKERAALYPLLFYRKGMKIAVLNYTFGTNNMPTPGQTYINRIDTAQIKRDLALTRSIKPDYTITVMHWGEESKVAENAEQQKLAQMLFRHGTNIVIGAHPHVVQPVKALKTTDLAGKSVGGLVVYSLGNFISGQNTPETSGGALFTLSLTKPDPNQKAHLAQAGFIPIWRHKTTETKPRYYVLPDTEAARSTLKPEEEKAMDAYFLKIRDRWGNLSEVRL